MVQLFLVIAPDLNPPTCTMQENQLTRLPWTSYVSSSLLEYS